MDLKFICLLVLVISLLPLTSKSKFDCLFFKSETEVFKDFPFPIWHDVKLFQKRMLEQRCRTIFSGTSVFSLRGFFSWRLRSCPAPALHWAFPAIWLTTLGPWSGLESSTQVTKPYTVFSALVSRGADALLKAQHLQCALFLQCWCPAEWVVTPEHASFHRHGFLQCHG